VRANGVPGAGLAGNNGTELRYTMAVSAGAANLTFATSGGTGDADLFVRFGSAPTFYEYDCRSFNAGNDETCGFASAKAGTYHVMVRGYRTFDGVSLTGSYSGGVANVPPTVNFSFTTSGLSASFTDTSTDSDGTIASRSWSFGDATTSTAASSRPTRTGPTTSR
jgi:vibriolysin